MKDNIEKRVAGVFLLVLTILVVVAFAAVRNIRRSIASSDWVNHTHAIIIESDAVLSSLHAGEAALRSYLLTGDKRDQGAYRVAFTEMIEHLEVAKALTRQEAAQQQKVLQLEALLVKRVDFTRSVVKSREQDGLEGARQALAADSDGENFAAIKRAVRNLKDEENALLQQRDKDSYLQAQTTHWTVLSGVALNFLLMAFAAWLLRDDLSARRKAATALEEANAQLERKVKERTAELAQANQLLQKENLERRWSNQALEHQLRYSQLIINSISDLVLVVSKALNVSRINPTVVHQTGMPAHEIIGSPLNRVLRLADDDYAGSAVKPEPIATALKEGREIQDWPATLLNKSGQRAAVRFSVIPLRDQDKVVGGVITVRLCPDPAPHPV